MCKGVYVYMCMCVCVYMCICVYVYMCICVYVYMCICVYVYMCIYVNVRMHTCIQEQKREENPDACVDLRDIILIALCRWLMVVDGMVAG